MQQRQLRLGDILDDYCPRERRVTNHAVVAMVGLDVKQTRCTTCDAEHEYKHAKVPRQRKKADAPAALHPANPASGPKRVSHEVQPSNGSEPEPPNSAGADAGSAAAGSTTPQESTVPADAAEGSGPIAARQDDASSGFEEAGDATDRGDDTERGREEEGPVHRPLIRASLPRPEGQQPPARPIPEFTIRQPGGRPNRFRPRHFRGGGQQFQGNRTNGNVAGGPSRGPRPGGGRPPIASRIGKRQGPDGQRRKRSK